MTDPEPGRGIRGGGTTGALVRDHNWSASPLGASERWSHSLRAHVRATLNTRQATCIFWGADYVNIYNDGFIPLLGEKHPRAMGESARDVWRDAWPVVGELLNRVFTTADPVIFQEMLVPIVRDGRLRDAWWNYSYSPLFGDDGAVEGILVVATETTAEVSGRKQLEAAKAGADQARHELHSVFMQAPLPMALLKGPKHQFALINAPYRALVGGRAMGGRTLREVFSEEEVGFYLPHLDHVLKTGEPVILHEAPLRLPDADGSVHERYIDVGYHPYRDGAEGATGVLAIIHDVTDKVAARMSESRLRESAEAANRAKDEFLAVVSHELRTPVNAILGWARLLRGITEPVKIAKGIAVIERNATAQTSLINDILDVSRIVTGKLRLDLRRVSLATVVQNALETVRPALQARGIACTVTLEDDLEIIADADRLQQVVWNLLSNAAKFTQEGGSMHIRAHRAAAEIAIDVSDTGKGITAEFLPFVFDRFRQADVSGTRRHGGLGLGLAIVRHLVELHGGRVEVQSEGLGQGSTFRVRLPVRAVIPREVSSSPALAESLAEPQAGGARPLTGVHVLVVDDEPEARELVAAVLGGAGADVVHACSAAEAMTALLAGGVTVLVADIAMPGRDGYGLVEDVRANSATRDVLALALTAFSRGEDRMNALRAGFDEHVPKPVDPDELVRRVAALAASPRASTPGPEADRSPAGTAL